MAFANPEDNVAKLRLREGEIVVDFGSGVGSYVIPAAKRVGQTGKVYAIDIQQDLLVNVRDRAREAGLSNVETIWADVEKPHGSKLEDSFADAAIVSNILFQSEKKDEILKEVKRILKPHGRLLVVDWTDSFGNLGPEAHMIFPQGEAKKLLMQNNFAYENEFEFGDHHYGLIFLKNG